MGRKVEDGHERGWAVACRTSKVAVDAHKAVLVRPVRVAHLGSTPVITPRGLCHDKGAGPYTPLTSLKVNQVAYSIVYTVLTSHGRLSARKMDLKVAACILTLCTFKQTYFPSTKRNWLVKNG